MSLSSARGLVWLPPLPVFLGGLPGVPAGEAGVPVGGAVEAAEPLAVAAGLVDDRFCRLRGAGFLLPAAALSRSRPCSLYFPKSCCIASMG